MKKKKASGIGRMLRNITARLVTLLLGAVMLLSAGIQVFADTPETGSITVNNAVVGQTYNIYRIFDLESYNKTSGSYAYKINTASGQDWSGFINQQSEGKYVIRDKYVRVDDQGYVTWMDSATDSMAVEFGELAKKWAKDHSEITPLQTKTAAAPAGDPDAATAALVFEGLPLGYYLIDSTLGVLCNLSTTNPNAETYEKNETPSIEKKVKRIGGAEDSSNVESIGDTVQFHTTVTAHNGAENYVVHDTMSGGLTFKPDTVVVESHVSGSETQTTLVVDTDYTVVTSGFEEGDTCTFEIRFTEDFLKTITGKTFINITYDALLNEKAVVGENGNDNKTHLTYGDGNKTTESETKTYTYSFTLVKTDGEDKVLTGAKFKLYDSNVEETRKEIPLILENDNYRVATETEITAKKAADPEWTTDLIAAGDVKVSGLRNGTYYLVETEAPQGYQKLKDAKAVTIDGKNLDAIVENDLYKSGGIQIINRSGLIMPSTGGTGTAVLYTVGALLVLAALVLLIAKSGAHK